MEKRSQRLLAFICALFLEFSLIFSDLPAKTLSGLPGAWLAGREIGADVAAVTAIPWNIGTGGDLLITTGGAYYVTGATTSNTITVNTSSPVTITLDNVSIDVSALAEKCALDCGANPHPLPERHQYPEELRKARDQGRGQ